MKLNSTLRAEYNQLWSSMQIRDLMRPIADDIVKKLRLYRAVEYQAVSLKTGIPWQVVAVIHAMETGIRFDRHLHNGDPLAKRTVRVPKGRPAVGRPPFKWEDSAIDALKLKGLHKWTDWSIAGILFVLESYNGWGYRKHHPDVKTPYLWSMSCHYFKGKYVADGKFDPEFVSKQCGAAVLLKRMQEVGVFDPIVGL